MRGLADYAVGLLLVLTHLAMMSWHERRSHSLDF